MGHPAWVSLGRTTTKVSVQNNVNTVMTIIIMSFIITVCSALCVERASSALLHEIILTSTLLSPCTDEKTEA